VSKRKKQEGSLHRQRLFKQLETAWCGFLESHAGLSEEQLLEPGVTGKWSVRDIVAHVTTWEEEALKHLPCILKGGTPPRYSTAYGGIDAFNARRTQEKKDLSTKEVFRQMNDVHRRLIRLLSEVSENELRSKTRFRRRLRLDTYGHYPKHTRAIGRWREIKGRKRDLQGSAESEFPGETRQGRLW
jgi:hypothetical protein